MRFGFVMNQKVITIESMKENGFHRISFETMEDKSKVAKLNWAPWGYNGFRVFLPVDVIEEKLEKFFPGIEFFNENGAVKVAA